MALLIHTLRNWGRHHLGWLALLAFVFGAPAGLGAETQLTEPQVKALFLFNFARYVDWPADAFDATNAPIVIGMIGEGKVGGELAKAIAGKHVEGRPILIRPLLKPEDWDRSHILYFGAEEKAGLVEMLDRIKTRPVLTVGETELFWAQGGVINFVKKAGKIRLEINLEAARLAGLQVSSKLLAVADVVKGK